MGHSRVLRNSSLSWWERGKEGGREGRRVGGRVGGRVGERVGEREEGREGEEGRNMADLKVHRLELQLCKHSLSLVEKLTFLVYICHTSTKEGSH